MAKSKIRTVLLSLLLGALLVAPIWLVVYPPLLDYPNHLARSFVLTHLNDPGSHLSQFYEADWGLYPYIAADVILVGLERVLPAQLAGRVFLSFCVLALPLAAWFFIRQANPGEDHMALWALLIAHNIFFLYGFMSFYLSLAVCFLALGLWLQYLARPRWALSCAVLVSMTVLYFTHVFGFAIAALLAIGYALAARRDFRTVLLSGLLCLPSALFFFHWRKMSAGAAGEVVFHSFREKIYALSATMHGYSPWLDGITVAALAAFFLVARWRNTEFRWNYRWLGLAGGLFAVYWALPEGYGDGAYFDIRVLPVLFVLLLIGARTGSRGRQLAALAVLLFLARTANLTQNFIAAQPELTGLARSFSRTPVNALVLPIVEADDPGEEHVRHPFAHFWAYGIIERRWFAPYLFHIHGVTPLRIRYQAYDPEGFWGLAYEEELDWSRVREDYDYVWAYNVPRFADELKEIGELVYADGRLELYRLNKPQDEP